MKQCCIAALCVLLTGAVSACGSLPRDFAPVRLADAGFVRTLDPRVSSEDIETLGELGQVVHAAAAREGRRPNILAISGGGANGAYGAGVLVGWTGQGDRPPFDLVTGVSTGALSAPFAFLGPDWDDELRTAYTSGQTEGLLSWRAVGAFFAPSLFGSGRLNELVEAHVTPDLLARIADQHDRGRRLLVVTTNLDSEQAVIWDMGLIARQGGDEALLLFRQVLVASASIPGVFPPVLIAGVNQDDQVVHEMHVDGGVTISFLAAPGGGLEVLAEVDEDVTLGGNVYVIVNGQTDYHYGVTPGRLPAILGRTYTTSTKATLRRELETAAGFAALSGQAFWVTDIPPDLEASSVDFGVEAMNALFDLGYGRAREGRAWRNVAAPARRTPPSTSETVPVPQ